MNSLLSNKDQDTMLEGILNWLNVNMDCFCTPNELDYGHLHPEKIKPDITRKAYTELGLALRFARKSPKISSHPLFEKIKNKWIDNITDNFVFFDTRRRLQLFPHRVLAHATLKSFGIKNEEYKNDLETVMENGYMDRVERSAWEKLDMKYYTEMAGLKNQFPSYEKLFQESTLNNLPSISYAQKYDFYGLTHLIFHFSDFSENDMKQLSGEKFNEIQEYIDATLCLCLIEQDWDLAQELLINQYCMRKKFTSLDIFTANAIKDIQQPEGFVPGREWVKEYHINPDFNKKDYSFKDVYHPTILALFLLTLETKE